jgi:hypothetical protein
MSDTKQPGRGAQIGRRAGIFMGRVLTHLAGTRTNEINPPQELYAQFNREVLSQGPDAKPRKVAREGISFIVTLDGRLRSYSLRKDGDCFAMRTEGRFESQQMGNMLDEYARRLFAAGPAERTERYTVPLVGEVIFTSESLPTHRTWSARYDDGMQSMLVSYRRDI